MVSFVVEFVSVSFLFLLLFRPGDILVFHWALCGVQAEPGFVSPLFVVVATTIGH